VLAEFVGPSLRLSLVRQAHPHPGHRSGRCGCARARGLIARTRRASAGLRLRAPS
jgi:hypothetical protein